MAGENEVDVGHVVRLLEELNKQLSKAPVLNGGFEKLCYDVETIKKSQSSLQDSVNSIKNSIYEPDDGIFARLKTLEQNTVMEKGARLSTSDQVDEIEEKIAEFSIEIDRLNQWKAAMNKMIWILASSTAGLVLQTIFAALQQ